ncbi:MAG: hypothetical protein DWP97_05890 [Calditrichaeota bacterium]|nr:MAG: hypothetical protein DWP97_05890 [Calditrichota bacterium]
MNGLLRDTIVELFDRKVIWVYLVITLIALIFLVFSANVKFNMGEIGQSDSVELKDLGFDLASWLLQFISSFYFFLTFITVLLTAGIIPNMFIKGRADFYLSKPISRGALIIKKFISVLVVYGSLILSTGLLVYITGILIHGGFSTHIFTLMLFTLGSYFIWLSISFFFGLFFGKSVGTIVSIGIVWFCQYLLSIYYTNKEIAGLIDAEITKKILNTLYYIFPKTGDFIDYGDALVSGTVPDNFFVVYSTLLFALFILFLSVTYFKKKNY